MMVLSARIQGIPLRYRIWETGFVISFFVALLGGVFFPIPGNYYPTEDIWHIQRLKAQLGKVALVSSLSALLISASLLLILRFFNLSSALENFLSTGFGAAFIFTVADILLPFFPFVSFNGRRLWDWNRWVWGGLAVIVIVIWALVFLKF